MKLNVKIKKLNENAVIPAYAHPTDAGMDLVAVSIDIDDNGCIVYRTGISIEIPTGFVGLLFPRSSISKYNLILTNSVGVIDSGYRGEIMFKFKPKAGCRLDCASLYYCVGERIGQLIILPYPKIEFDEVEELSECDRGTGGYGSTGK